VADRKSLGESRQTSSENIDLCGLILAVFETARYAKHRTSDQKARAQIFDHSLFDQQLLVMASND
jgi:hypothetical protein